MAAAYQLITVCPSKSRTSRNIKQAALLSPRGGGQELREHLPSAGLKFPALRLLSCFLHLGAVLNSGSK